MKTLLLSLVLLLFGGCENRQDPDGSHRRLNDRIEMFMPPIGGSVPLQEKESAIISEIRALPSYEARRAYVGRWVDSMLSFDMRTLGYYDQGRNIRAVHDLILFKAPEVMGSDSPSASADVWDIYLKMMKWLYDQVDRLGMKDRPSSGMVGNCVTNVVQARAFKNWFNCYNLCTGTYKATIRRLGKQGLDSLRKRGVSPLTCEALKLRLEEFLRACPVRAE